MKKSNEDVFYVSRKGEQALLAEYYGIDDEYKATTRAMGVSDSLDSDLRENAEFMELRVKAMYTLPNKKRELYEKIKNRVIIEDTDEYKNFDGKTVIMCSEVKMCIDGEIETYTILGTNEGNIRENILSENAPMVQAIMHHKVGEVVDFNDMSIEILEVKRIE